MAVEKGNKNAKEILFRTGFDHLARAGSEQGQEMILAQEGPGHGPAPHRREGRKAAEVHGQDVEALQGEAPGGLDAPDGRRALQARRHPDGVRGNALPGVLPPSVYRRRGLSKEVLPPLPRCQKRRKTRNRDAKKYRNGVVRKILPKGSPFDAILDGEMRRIDRMLNDRPLKCLDWRTPREAFTALPHRHLLAAA